MRTKSAQRGAETPHGARVGRKRRASITSAGPSLSRGSSQVNEPTPSPQKRRRHSKVISVEHTDFSELAYDDDIDELVDLDDTKLLVRPSVRFSSLGPPSSQSIRQWTPPAPSPITYTEQQFTPLRAKIDPRTRRRLRRSHLSEEMNELYEHDRRDAKNRAELERLRKMMEEKEEQITRLTKELEETRKAAVVMGQDNEETSEKLRALAMELDTLQKEQQELEDNRAQLDLNDVDMTPIMDYVDSDDDEPVDATFTQDTIVQPSPYSTQPTEVSNDANDSILQRSFYVTTSTTTGQGDASTQVALPDINHIKQIELYEEHLSTLLHKVADLEADLTKLNYSIQGLGFSEKGTDPRTVLTTISQCFENARTEMDRLLPGRNAANLENSRVLPTLLSSLKNVMSELDERIEHLRAHQNRNEVLAKDKKELTERIEALEARKEHLEAQWYEMDVDRESKEKRILELEDELDQLQETLEEREKELGERSETVETLETDLSDKEVALDRITRAMERYRDEAENYAKTIERLQQQHEALVSKMQKDHQAQVENLTNDLENANDMRQQAEDDADAKQTVITQLELKVEDMSSKLDDMRETSRKLKADLESTTKARDDLSEEVTEQQATIEILERRISFTESRLEDLQNDLDRLKELKDSECRQREQAEADLDEANTELAEKDERLRQSGQREQELRGKLWEVQNAKQSAIDELNRTIAARDERYQEDMSAEIERREQAEATVEDLSTQVEDLQARLDETIAEKDAITSEKNQLISKMQANIDQLQSDLQKSQDAYARMTSEKNTRINDLEAELVELSTLVTNHTSTIEAMKKEAIETASANQAVIDEQDEIINNLGNELDEAKANIEDLESDKANLGHRLEAQIAEMRDFQHQHDTEMAELRDTINSQEDVIADLNSAAAAREREVESIISEKDKEYSLLQQIAETRDATNKVLLAQLEELKQRFQALVEDGKETTQAQVREIEAALKRAKERSDSFIDRSGRENEQVARVGSSATNGYPTSSAETPKAEEPVSSGWGWAKVRGRGKKRRSGFWGDSALGVATSSDAEDTLLA